MCPPSKPARAKRLPRAKGAERTGKKGDAASVAQLAGIMGAKKTAELIPLCHPLPLSSVKLEIEPLADDGRVKVTARVKTNGPTGVEMEALTAVAVACLTLYDMLKSSDRSMVIEDIALDAKTGGASGPYRRAGPGA